MITAAISVFAIVLHGNKKVEVDGSGVFERYANYLLYGEDKTTTLNEFDPNETFYIDENYANPEYMDTLKNLFASFYNSTQKDEDLKYISLSMSEERLDFLVEYSKFSFLNTENVIDMYKLNGKEKAAESIKNYYSVDSDDEASNGSNVFMRMIKELDAEELTIFLTYYSDNNNSDLARLDDIEKEKNDIIYSAINFLKNQCLEVVNFGEDSYAE